MTTGTLSAALQTARAWCLGSLVASLVAAAGAFPLASWIKAKARPSKPVPVVLPCGCCHCHEFKFYCTCKAVGQSEAPFGVEQ